jgi:hypothetical protein
MENLPLRPLTTLVEYQGQYAAVALRLLANPVPVYEALLGSFKKYGLSLRDLKFEAGDLSETNINCHLLNFSIMVRVRSERLEVTFYALDAWGREKAGQLVADAWQAIKGANPTLELMQHVVTFGMNLELPHGLTLNELMRRYVLPPRDLKPHVNSGVIFYLGENPTTGENGGSIIMDASAFKAGALYIRVIANFDATKVPIELLGVHSDEYLTRQLSSLGLALEQVK